MRHVGGLEDKGLFNLVKIVLIKVVLHSSFESVGSHNIFSLLLLFTFFK